MFMNILTIWTEFKRQLAVIGAGFMPRFSFENRRFALVACSRLFLSLLIVFFSIAPGLVPNANASVPGVINYQGRLTDGNGNPLTGTYSFTFNIYEELSGVSGSPLIGPISIPNLVVSNGVFSAQIPISVTDLAAHPDTFLEITVDDGTGSPETLTPRQQLLSAPYAINAANADLSADSLKLGGQPASQFIRYTGGNVGIGTPLPIAALDVNGNVHIRGNRITGSFDDDPTAGIIIQNSKPDYWTLLQLMPNGTSPLSGFLLYGKSDINNAPYGVLTIGEYPSENAVSLDLYKSGSATLPDFYVRNPTDVLFAVKPAGNEIGRAHV